jgi:hypothetical protein
MKRSAFGGGRADSAWSVTNQVGAHAWPEERCVAGGEPPTQEAGRTRLSICSECRAGAFGLLRRQEIEPPEVILDWRHLEISEPGLLRVAAHAILAHDGASSRSVLADHADG